VTRAEARALRDRLAPAKRRLWSGRIAEHVLAWDAFRGARTVMAYASIGSEPDTRRLLSKILEQGKRLLLPRCFGEGVMAAMEVERLSCLVPGAFGILEPPEGASPADKGSIDLCLVPGLRFDLRGNRIGRGAGYYDRFLKGFEGVSCGIAFAEQIVEAVEVRPHDVPVGAIVTEFGVFTAGRDGYA